MVEFYTSPMLRRVVLTPQAGVHGCGHSTVHSAVGGGCGGDCWGEDSGCALERLAVVLLSLFLFLLFLLCNVLRLRLTQFPINYVGAGYCCEDGQCAANTVMLVMQQSDLGVCVWCGTMAMVFKTDVLFRD